jgi:hypothetical protein
MSYLTMLKVRWKLLHDNAGRLHSVPRSWMRLGGEEELVEECNKSIGLKGDTSG